MSFNSNNFKKFAREINPLAAFEGFSPEAIESAANDEFNKGNVNNAQLAYELAKQIRENKGKPGYTWDKAVAHTQDIMKRRAFNTQQRLANSASAKQFAQWQGRQRFNQAYNQLSLWDKLRYMWGGLMNKMGLGGENSYFNQFNKKQQTSISQGIREDLGKALGKEMEARYAKSLGFVDEKGNPLAYDKMNPEQQAVFRKGYYPFYEAHEKEVLDQMATPETQEAPGWLHFIDKGVHERIGTQYDERLKPYKDTQYTSSLTPQQSYDFIVQPGQQTVTKGLTPTTPVASAQSYTGISYPKSSQPPSRIQSKINNANPRRRPQDSRKQSIVQTPSTRLSAQEAADEFQV